MKAQSSLLIIMDMPELCIIDVDDDSNKKFGPQAGPQVKYLICQQSCLFKILTHLAYRVIAKKSVIYQTIIHSFERARKVRAS